MMNLYQETLMDHYRHPRNRHTLNPADFSSDIYNPSCGDSISFSGCISSNGMISRAAFQGSGCVISQATASMLTQIILHKPIHEVANLDKQFVLDLIGIELGPMRLKCALLSLEALQQGLSLYLEAKVKGA
jgi:nitrogen fixation NifU-like protein